MFEHRGDQARQLVGGGGEGLWSPSPRGHPSAQGASGALALMPSRRRAPEGGGRRLRPLPPATRGCGHRPHHEGQGGTVGQRVLSRPLSRRMIKDVGSAMPSICVRATPRRRSRGARTAQAG